MKKVASHAIAASDVNIDKKMWHEIFVLLFLVLIYPMENAKLVNIYFSLRSVTFLGKVQQ